MCRYALARFAGKAGQYILGACAAIAIPAMAAQGANIIINHTNWNWYNSQPQQVIDAVAAQKIFFAHASVGGNIMSGFGDLHTADPAHYPLQQTSVTGTPPGSTSNGTLYEYMRDNPGWEAKISWFEGYLSNGWHAPTATIAMNKFCFIDQTADWVAYRDSMLALEAAYFSTKIIYWTMPLTTDSDADAVLRAQFNQNLRNWIATQDNKILFDIADIEAWDTGGVHQTFVYSTQIYEHLADDYSADGGHLNQTGYDRVAMGLYSLFGQVATAGPVQSPTVSPTRTLSSTPTPTVTTTPTATNTSTMTASSTATATPTATLTSIVTATSTATATPTATVTPILTPAPTMTTTPMVVTTSSPIASSTTLATSTRTALPTQTQTSTASAVAFSGPRAVLSACPNPGKDRMLFSLRLGQSAGIIIRIYNFSGELVAELNGSASNGQATLEWDCSRLAPGIYLVQASSAGTTIQKIKVAIAR